MSTMKTCLVCCARSALFSRKMCNWWFTALGGLGLGEAKVVFNLSDCLRHPCDLLDVDAPHAPHRITQLFCHRLAVRLRRGV